MALRRLTPPEWRAIAIAPLAAPIAYWAGAQLIGIARAVSGRSSGSLAPLRTLGMVMGVGAPIAYVAMALLGLPVYVATRAVMRVNRAALWGDGAIVGAVVALVLGPALKGELFSIPFPLWAGMLVGVATAEVFWQLLARGSPGDEPTSDARPRGGGGELRQP